MSIIGTIYEDVTTDALGDIGSWQWFVTMLSTFLMTSSFFQHYEYIFLLEPNRIMCIPSEEHDIYNETLCSYTLGNGTEISCNKWYLKLLWAVWVKKSWLLFCDDKMKLLLTAVIFRLATIFGFVIFGLVADSFGRRKAIIVNVFTVFIFKAVGTFCDSEAWFRLILFLEALFGTATMFVGLIIVSEIASNTWRSWLNVIIMSPRLVALVSTVHIANGASNPETYNLFGCLFGLVSIFLMKWLPESPQWMLYNRKINVAEKLLLEAANKNNIKFSAEFKIRPVNYRAYLCLDETMTCFSILSIHNVRVIVAVTLIFWGVFHFIWGYLYLKIYSEGTGFTISVKVLSSLVGMGFLTQLLSNLLSLQQLLIINILFTACVTAGVIILQHQIIHDILSMLALASGLMVYALMLNMTPRYFAINIRATLFGCCHATGQIGAMISYIIFIYKAMDDITFVALEMGLSLILVVFSFILPQVDGRELPDIMEDMNVFSELSKPLRWVTQKRSSASKEEVQMRIYSFGSALSASMENSYSQPRVTRRRKKFMKPWHRIIKYFQRRKHRSSVSTTVQSQNRVADENAQTPSEATVVSVVTSNTSYVQSIEKSIATGTTTNVDSETEDVLKSLTDVSSSTHHSETEQFTKTDAININN